MFEFIVLFVFIESASLYLPWNRLWSWYDNKHKYYNNNSPDMYFLRYVVYLFYVVCSLLQF